MMKKKNVANCTFINENFVAEIPIEAEKIVASFTLKSKNFVIRPLIIGPRYGKILVKTRIRRSVYAVSKGL